MLCNLSEYELTNLKFWFGLTLQIKLLSYFFNASLHQLLVTDRLYHVNKNPGDMAWLCGFLPRREKDWAKISSRDVKI